MADGEVEVEEKGKREMDWKKEKRELLIALYDCARLQLMKTARIGTKYGNTRSIFMREQARWQKKNSPQTSSKVGL